MCAAVIMTQTSTINELNKDLIHLPFIHIQPLSFNENVLNHHYHWIIFSSKNAVKYFLPYLKQVKYDRIAVIGEKTKRFCEQHHIQVDFCPSDYSQEGFLASFEVHENDSIFIPSSAAARPLLTTQLKRSGANVTKIDLYQPMKHAENIEHAIELCQTQQADGIAFASSSAARNFFEVLKDKGMQLAIDYYAIGQPTYDTIKKYGYEARIAKSQTIDGLMNTIKESRNHK